MSQTDTIKPVPAPNPETRAFWEACNNEQLTVQGCEDCGHKQHYPRLLCTSCRSSNLTQVPVSGRGTITSFTINRVPVSSAFAETLPYAVGMIHLEEGPCFMANIIDCDPETLHIGQSVVVLFETRGNQKLPQFRPL